MKLKASCSHYIINGNLFFPLLLPFLLNFSHFRLCLFGGKSFFWALKCARHTSHDKNISYEKLKFFHLRPLSREKHYARWDLECVMKCRRVRKSGREWKKAFPILSQCFPVDTISRIFFWRLVMIFDLNSPSVFYMNLCGKNISQQIFSNKGRAIGVYMNQVDVRFLSME